jgi:hypothetical protein
VLRDGPFRHRIVFGAICCRYRGAFGFFCDKVVAIVDVPIWDRIDGTVSACGRFDLPISVWLNGWPVNVFDNLELVFLPHSVLLYLAFLVAAIFVTRGVEFFALLVYTVIATGLLLAPGTGSLLMHIVTPAAFWRFAYALPVPLWVALAVSGLLEEGRRPYALGISCAISAGVLALLTFVIKSSAISRDVIARPGLKFYREDLTQVYEISRLIKGRAVVLGPPDIVIPLALLRPDMRFIVTRSDETMVVFANAGLKEEGILRGSVSAAIASCDMSNIPDVRSEQLWPDMNVVVFPNQCEEERVRTFLALGENWRDVPLASYHLLVRTNN